MPHKYLLREYTIMSMKHSKSSKPFKKVPKEESITVSTPPDTQSQQVRKWLAGCGDQRLVEMFTRAVNELESSESRINRTKGDGWYPKYEASHLRFYGRFAVFYRYEGTSLHILAVMGKAKNDHDYEFAWAIMTERWSNVTIMIPFPSRIFFSCSWPTPTARSVHAASLS